MKHLVVILLFFLPLLDMTRYQSAFHASGTILAYKLDMILKIDPAELKERACAAFIGMAIGDALGATVEFMTTTEIANKYGVFKEITGGGWLRLKPGQVTDDTEMALCIARAVSKNQGWSRESIASEFAKWLKSKPVDCGDTCRKGIRSYMLHGTLEVPYNNWDGGNGAAMRMLPAALFSFPDSELLKKYAIEQARLTHNQALSDASCIFIGSLIHLILQGVSKQRLRSEVDGFVARFPGFNFNPYRGLATGYVVDTMQTVFHWFFKGAGFEECLVGTVNQGGDADTTAAICGMLAGAYYGMDAIPKRWIKKMSQSLIHEIELYAERLIMASPALTGI